MSERLVSFDLGNGYVKARSSTTSQVLSWPSVLSVVDETLEGFEFDLSPDGDFVIGLDGQQFAIGETVRYKGLTPVTIAHRSRIQTDFYRVMFASALAATVKQPADIKAVVSLPPAAYWDKDKQKATLADTYEVETTDESGRWRALEYRVVEDNIRVIPEGVGAVCTLVLDPRGNELEDAYLHQTVVGIVDVGTYTTDLIQLDRLKIVRDGCDSFSHALSDVHKKLRTYAAKMGHDLDVYRADEVLNQGWFIKDGRRHSVEEISEDWAKQLAQSIAGQIRTTWNGGDDVEAILVTGGGGLWVYKYLAMEFPHVYMVEKVPPHAANCEGGWRYGLLRDYAERQGV